MYKGLGHHVAKICIRIGKFELVPSDQLLWNVVQVGPDCCGGPKEGEGISDLKAKGPKGAWANMQSPISVYHSEKTLQYTALKEKDMHNVYYV